jgi:hypothetical protein
LQNALGCFFSKANMQLAFDVKAYGLASFRSPAPLLIRSSSFFAGFP